VQFTRRGKAFGVCKLSQDREAALDVRRFIRPVFVGAPCKLVFWL